jgi:hypothetical protein
MSRQIFIRYFHIGLYIFCVSLVSLQLYAMPWFQLLLLPSPPPRVVKKLPEARLRDRPKHEIATVDENAYLRERDAFYRHLPPQYAQGNNRCQFRGIIGVSSLFPGDNRCQFTFPGG